MASATTVIQMYLSAAWVDVSSDVLASPYIRWRSGFGYDEPTAFVADNGDLEFWLDNSSKNSGAKQGYYSPGHANARTGFELGTRVRVKTTYSGADRYQFHGRISEIEPEAGKYGARNTRVLATDYMEELSTRYIDILALQSSKTSNQLLTTLISSMDIAPQATSYDTGPDTFASAFHDLQGERQVAATVAQKIVQSDLSKLYVTGDATMGETLVLANRHDDIGKTSQLTLNDTMNGLDVERSRNNINNRIVVSFRPIDEGGANEVLYTLSQNMQLGVSASYTFTALYRDPDGGERLCGRSMVTPVIDTDYQFSSAETGNDLNASLGVSVTFGADRAEVTLTNNHGSKTGYVTLFQLRGLALRLRDAVEVVSEDSSSISAYGEKRLEYRTPYQNSFNTTRDFAEFLKSKWANPKYKVKKVRYIGNTNSTLMSGAVNRDIGDMITVTETMTGINDTFIIIGRNVSIRPGGIWNVEYILRDPLEGSYWLLGTGGSSELGDTTTLGV
jgi:hypothetical protein